MSNGHKFTCIKMHLNNHLKSQQFVCGCCLPSYLMFQSHDQLWWTWLLIDVSWPGVQWKPKRVHTIASATFKGITSPLHVACGYLMQIMVHLTVKDRFYIREGENLYFLYNVFSKLDQVLYASAEVSLITIATTISIQLSVFCGMSSNFD